MKKDGRSLSHEVSEAFRFSSVNLRKEGVSINVIAKSFSVCREAVSRWISKAKRHGVESLKSTKAGGPEPFLREKQFKKLIGLLRLEATKLKYPTDLWSGPRVRHLIKHQFGINYHPKHMPRFLRRLGLILKFPERRALEQDPEKVRIWKEEALPKILASSKRKKALVFYADESLVTLIPYVGKTWTFPEVKPIVRVSGKRGQNVGITAAVNQKGFLCFELTREGERFTAKRFLRFIRKLHREFSNRCITLIVDGAPIHKANLVKQYQNDNKSWFRLEILPPYSPEMNPSEKAWNFIKTKKLNGCTAKDKKELREETKSAMKSLKKNTKKVASFFDR